MHRLFVTHMESASARGPAHCDSNGSLHLLHLHLKAENPLLCTLENTSGVRVFVSLYTSRDLWHVPPSSLYPHLLPTPSLLQSH